jgi:hypothetical protein
MRRGHKRLVVAGALFAAALLVGGVAYATIPDGSGVYTACELRATGTIRLIDPSLGNGSLLGHCNSVLEKEITWNAQGQPGVAGTPGSAGPQGPAGQQGLPGPAGPLFDPQRLYVATATVNGGVSVNPTGYLDATCNPGDALLSGGFDESFQPTGKVLGSFPENGLFRTDGFGPAWSVKYQYLSSGDEIDSYAVCLKMNGSS